MVFYALLSPKFDFALNRLFRRRPFEDLLHDVVILALSACLVARGRRNPDPPRLMKTNVFFFTRGAKDTGNAVWVYDMRTNMHSFGKRTPLTEEHFKDFETAYGSDPYGGSKRKDQGEECRGRKFTREDIAKSEDSLDTPWLLDEEASSADDLPEPDVIASEILVRLQTAMTAIQELQEMIDE